MLLAPVLPPVALLRCQYGVMGYAGTNTSLPTMIGGDRIGLPRSLKFSGSMTSRKMDWESNSLHIKHRLSDL